MRRCIFLASAWLALVLGAACPSDPPADATADAGAPDVPSPPRDDGATTPDPGPPDVPAAPDPGHGDDAGSDAADVLLGPDTAGLTLEELLALWEADAIEYGPLLDALAGLEQVAPGAAIPSPLEEAILLAAGEHALGDAPGVAASGALVLGPGAVLVLPAAATLTVDGRLYAFGAEGELARIRGDEAAPYATVLLRGGRSELHHTRVEHGDTLVSVHGTGDAVVRLAQTQLEHWGTLAVSVQDADGLHIRGCQLGVDSAGEDHGEALRGLRSAVRIEASTFGFMTGYSDAIDLEQCDPPHTPWLVGNRFLGGEDDGIDLDYCDAVVVGNHLSDFFPPDPTAPFKGVNGGGITGEASSPLLINNVVTGCFHGIGFKNGSQPVMIHNTVVDGNIGLALYRSTPSHPDPHGVSINDIFWNNRAWDDPSVVQDIELHGRWWPSYDQSDGDQATLDARHLVAGVAVAGPENLTDDPQLGMSQGVPVPAAGSPAVDSGFAGPWDLGTLAEAWAAALVAQDHFGKPRPSPSGGLPDRGAVERE